MRARRADAAAVLALAIAVCLAAGCSAPATRQVEVGPHRVRFVLPEGWEHLNHGREHLLRLGEAQVSLQDLGPATRAATTGDSNQVEPLLPDEMLEFVLSRAARTRGREIAQQARRTIHGSDWLEVLTWNRVTHRDRARVAFLVNGGRFLALTMDRGLYEQLEPGFEAVLSSLDVDADTSAAR